MNPTRARVLHSALEAGKGITMPEVAIQTQKLTRRFGNLTAVDGIDLQVTAGQFFRFFRPNGPGETTTTQNFTRFLSPTPRRMELFGLGFSADPPCLETPNWFVSERMGPFQR